MGNMEFGGASEDSESKRTWSRGECLQSSGLMGVDGNGLCRLGCGRAGRPQGRAGHSQYLPGVPGTRLKVSEQVSRPRAAPALGPTAQGRTRALSTGPEAAFPLAFCKTQVWWSCTLKRCCCESGTAPLAGWQAAQAAESLQRCSVKPS